MLARDLANWWAGVKRSPENIDRILIGVCALVWLLWLGMSVAAAVALVDLGRGFHAPAHNAHTGLLYIIIGVSALIILAAVPILLWARRTGPAPVSREVPGARSAVPPGRPVPPAAGARPAPTGRAAAAPTRPGLGAVDRILLRGTTELASTVGAALTIVALATYLMAVGKETAAWTGYGLAGVATILMPVVPWRYLRQLPDGYR